jgi:hypothetical protein
MINGDTHKYFDETNLKELYLFSDYTAHTVHYTETCVRLGDLGVNNAVPYVT